MRLLRRSLHGEDGAVAVIAGVSLLTLLLMASYVIDLGFLRADRIASQTVADMAAAAAVVDLDPSADDSAQAGCTNALEFARANLAVEYGDSFALSAVAGASCSAIFPAGYTCDPAEPRTARYRGSPFTIEIVHPIPASPDDTGTYDRFMSGQDADALHDGTPCERFGVSVEHDRAGFLFGGQRTTTRNAVARRFLDGEDGDYASLVVLLRNGCPSLTASGGAFVNVMNLTREEPAEDGSGDVEVTYPGNITVDTLPPSGPCGGNPVIGVSGAGTKILASGRLVAHALLSADPGNASGKTHSDTPPERLTPPEPGPRITRSPVDHKFNCIDDYPSGQTWSPQRDGQPISGCTSETAEDHVRKLRTELSAVTATTAGWQRFPDSTKFPGHSCTNSSATAAITAAVAGTTKLFVDCGVGGASMVNNTGRMRFEGFSHIVFREGIRLSSSGRFEIRGPATTGTVAYLQSGRLEQSGGKMLLENTFVYLDGPSTATNGAGAEFVGITGSMETFAHQAPLDRDNCPASGTPNGSCFAPLALWSNALAEHSILGGGGLGVIGSVFTPNAVMKLRTGEASGGDECSDTPSFSELEALPSGGMNMDAAQFFSEAINISGGGELRMCPNPETTIQVPLWGNGLIR